MEFISGLLFHRLAVPLSSLMVASLTKTLLSLRPVARAVLGGLILMPAASATYAAALFGLVDTGELYRSTNGGANWSIHATLAVHDAVGLAASSSASHLTIVTRTGSVYQSIDGGTSWTPAGAISASDVVGFTILPDSKMLALTESGTIYQSMDGGASFTGLATLTAPNYVSLIRGPLGRLYALTRTGEVYESQTNGTSWIPVGSVTVSGAVAMQRYGAELFILTETGEVYRSLNYGVTWLPVGAITASNMSAMVSTGTAMVAASRTGEVYQSTSGTTWTPHGAVNQLNLVSLGSDQPFATGVPVEGAAPKLVIGAPYPNPASGGSGVFPFTLDRPGVVTLEMFDVGGRRIASRARASLPSGSHALDWTPKGIAAGRYFIRYVVDGRATAAVPWAILR